MINTNSKTNNNQPIITNNQNFNYENQVISPTISNLTEQPEYMQYSSDLGNEWQIRQSQTNLNEQQQNLARQDLGGNNPIENNNNDNDDDEDLL